MERELKLFKRAVYIVLFILITIFYTKDIDFFPNNFYKDIIEITVPDDVLVLVNKNNKLPNDYIPNDLELLDVRFANASKYVKREVKYAYERMATNALLNGYTVVAVSTYRDYYYQDKLYYEYVKDKGKNYADKCSARAGHSEHQTGLAIDIMGSNNDYDNFDKSREFEWIKHNAHKYGFILRYPKDKENITGFKYEPWHYRYIGVLHAKYIYENNITLEEYLDII